MTAFYRSQIGRLDRWSVEYEETYRRDFI